MPLAGWPLDPGWRDNTLRHPKTYLMNRTFEDGFHPMRLRYDERPDPKRGAARQHVANLEFNAWMTLILGGFVIPFALFALPEYLN